MDHGFVNLRHTNGDIETMDNPNDSSAATPRPRLEDLHIEDIDTDIELDGDVGEPYMTPVALQKNKKTMPVQVIESSEGEDFESEVEQKKQKVIKKNKNKGQKNTNKGQRPVLDRATQVSDKIIDLVDNGNSNINGSTFPNIEKITCNHSWIKVSCRLRT